MVKVVIFNQQPMTYYVSTIDFKVQFVQVYSVTQNYMYLTIFGRDLKIHSCNRVFGVSDCFQYCFLSCIKKLLNNAGAYKNSKVWS